MIGSTDRSAPGELGGETGAMAPFPSNIRHLGHGGCSHCGGRRPVAPAHVAQTPAIATRSASMTNPVSCCTLRASAVSVGRSSSTTAPHTLADEMGVAVVGPVVDDRGRRRAAAASGRRARSGARACGTRSHGPVAPGSFSTASKISAAVKWWSSAFEDRPRGRPLRAGVTRPPLLPDLGQRVS